ncbi:MAG: V-type ATP synthase subunit D [Candidatus Omnitrophota bacterium]|nr:V-type ATP synthase subunit D [Candidatus Omnitrophota bacterium]
MGQVKLTKGELKRQRDCLKQYERYLPTLQLKKQQLQIEILWQATLLSEKNHTLDKKKEATLTWSALLTEPGINLKAWIIPSRITTTTKNIAGTALSVFKDAAFDEAKYDLFTTPLWIDHAVEALRLIVSLQKEIEVLEKGLLTLKNELRITTQRVNLFEKIKIPQAQKAIRLIKIYIGDQMTNAVGRSKIAKKKIVEQEVFERASV